MEKYELSGMPVPATKHDVAEWAIKKRLWEPRPIDIVSQCADDLARALREEYRTGNNGQRVRTKHVVGRSRYAAKKQQRPKNGKV